MAHFRICLITRPSYLIIHPCSQVQQFSYARWRETVAVHVLSQQGNLLETTVVQIANLTQDAFGIAAALTSTGIRHDAVVAKVVATTHDAYETAHSVAFKVPCITTDLAGFGLWANSEKGSYSENVRSKSEALIVSLLVQYQL